MKKKLVIIITIVLILILALLVLWKLDVFNNNESSPVVKEEKVEKDELSILLDLEYPQLGDNIQEAHTLYGEPKSETNGQKNSQLSEKIEKEISINYTQNDVITSLNFNVDGDKEKIKILAERLLPSGYTRVEDSEQSSDSQNSFYYRLPEGYAVILINNDAIESEDKKNTGNKVEVAYLSESEFNSATNQDDNASEEETTQGNAETQEDKVPQKENQSQEANTSPESSQDESQTDKETEPSPTKNTGEFDVTSAQINNQKVKHPDFLTNAKQGIIQGIDVALLSTVGSMMESHGQPDWIVEVDGGSDLMYKNLHMGFGVPHEYDEDPQTPITTYYLPINITEKEVIQSLGEPTSKDYSELNGSYLLYYDLGNHELFFNKDTDNPEETYKSVKLKSGMEA